MLEFQPGARAYLLDIHALSTDGDGNEVFVGMTLKESVWYQQYLEDSFSGNADRTDDSQERYLALHDKHEGARQTVIANVHKPIIQ
jgi:hypothetical protein